MKLITIDTNELCHECRGKLALYSNESSVLEALAHDELPSVRKTVAINRNTPEKILVMLSSDSSSWVRHSVVKNPNISQKLLEKIAKKRAENVDTRCEAINKITNPERKNELLVKLAKDSKPGVRAEVARSSNTPVEILAILAEDTSYSVRCAVAENPNTPEDALAILAKDNMEVVRRSVAENPSATDKVFKILAEAGIKKGILGMWEMSPKLLELLAKDDSTNVRMDVARHRNTTIETLEVLAHDTSSRVKNLAINRLRNSR